jgi:hypothetical protein
MTRGLSLESADISSMSEATESLDASFITVTLGNMQKLIHSQQT